MEKVSCLEAEEELQVEVDCGQTDKLTVELNLGIAEMFVSGLRYTIAVAFTLFIFCLVRYKCSAVRPHWWRTSTGGRRPARAARDSGDTAVDVDMETGRRSIAPVQRSSRNKGPMSNLPWRR